MPDYTETPSAAWFRGYEAVSRPTAAVWNGQIVFLNRAARQLCDADYLGRTPAELFGETLGALSSTREDAFFSDCQILDRNCALEFLCGDPCFYLFEPHDEARLEEETRQELDTLSSALRGPLSLMMQAMDGLRLHFPESERSMQYFTAVERSIFQLTGLAQHMSLLHDLSVPDPTLHMEQGDLGELLRNCAAGAERACAMLGVTLETRLPTENVPALYDRQNLETMVYILLAHGAAHCGTAPLEFSFAASPARYEIIVSYAANDASAGSLDEMFDLMSGKSATPEGLGLSAAWQIARIHRGSLMIRHSAAGTQLTAVIGKELPAAILRQPFLFRGGLPPLLVEFAPLLSGPDFHQLRESVGHHTVGRLK